MNIIIPHQDYISVDVIAEDCRVDIRQEDSTGNTAEQVVSVYGQSNLVLLIEALIEAREQLQCPHPSKRTEERGKA